MTEGFLSVPWFNQIIMIVGLSENLSSLNRLFVVDIRRYIIFLAYVPFPNKVKDIQKGDVAFPGLLRGQGLNSYLLIIVH